MHYYPFHVGDYIQSTVHLSNEEDLAYRRLIDFYMTTESPITQETQWVSRRLRVSIESIEFILKEFFKPSEYGLYNLRCDMEIAHYYNMEYRNRRNGAKGGRPTNQSLNNIENPVGFQSVPSRNPNQEPRTKNQEPNNNIEPTALVETNVSTIDNVSDIKKPKVDQIPYAKVVELYHELLPELPRVFDLSAKRKSQIRSRWLSGALNDLEQWTLYFKDVSKSKFLMGRVQTVNSRKPFKADLEWLTNESNFLKVAEGKYHE